MKASGECWTASACRKIRKRLCCVGPTMPDTRIVQQDVRKAGFIKMSMMPEGLLEALTATDVSGLFAYLLTLK